MKKLIIILMALIAYSTHVFADKVSFTASAPDAVVVGEQFRLSYIVTTQKVKDFRAPSIKGFDVLMGPSRSQQSSTQIVNGNVTSTSSITFTYILMANNAGEYTIPGASIVADGDQMVSNSVKIKVLPQDQGGNSGQNNSSSGSIHSSSGTSVSNQDLFIMASASKTNVYEQEAFVLTYKIYTRESNLQLNNAKLPDFKGFHSQEIEMTTNARWTPEHYQGRNYYTTVYRQFVLFPQQSGKLYIDPAQFQMASRGIQASVSGRPKHIYSIWRKMCKKNLKFEQLFDVRAIRIIVDSVEKCYETLSLIQESFEVLSKEFDDYIAKPKPNGYQSLHTVIVGSRGKPLEIQIRTRAMHEFAELGVAAHWRYKEGSKRKAGEHEEDRVAWLRQMLAWKSDVQAAPTPEAAKDEHIYVLTPQGKVLDLPAGSTPIDFAYLLHTELGHRCRGAKVDGVMVPLNTKLQSGQTVEIIAAKVGAPSRDWLNPDLGFTASPRSRTKVRQWFNAQEMEQALTAGREKVDKDLARLGKTAVKLEDLAKRLGFNTVDDLCLAAGKDELGQKAIENVLAPRPQKNPQEEEKLETAAPKKTTEHDKGKILVVGVDSLLTQLARCCHPVPPDEIVGFVTRGRGVTVHRADCPNIRSLDEEGRDRLTKNVCLKFH